MKLKALLVFVGLAFIWVRPSVGSEACTARYFIALESAYIAEDLERITVEIQSFDQKADAFVKNDTIENQERSARPSNFSAVKQKWTLLKDFPIHEHLRGPGHQKIEFYGEEAMPVAEVTHAMQYKNGQPQLNLALTIQDEKGNVIIGPDNGILSTPPISNLDVHLVIAYNKTNPAFPYRAPNKLWVMDQYRAQEVIPLGPDEYTRFYDVGSHGLHFSQHETLPSNFWLGLYKLDCP